MELDFWHRRWRKNEIAFHQPQINTHLQQFWHHLHLPPGGQVFVPLCGKSLDMLWLAAQGYTVLGVEISAIAIESFFRENELTPQVHSAGAFQVWQTDEISLWLGDFFALTPADLAGIAGVYDRASLIALPPARRQDYARHLHTILPPVEVLLVTLEYPQAAMAGPPFAVTEAEVATLYASAYQIERLYVHDALAENPRFHDRLSWLTEKVYRLQPWAALAAGAPA